MQNLIEAQLPEQVKKIEVKTGWYVGSYRLNPNSGSSPMPHAGQAGYIFVYFYRDVDRRIYSVVYQKTILPHQPNLLEKHGPFEDGDLTLSPTGWGTVNGNIHCEFFLPKAEILPGAYIRSKPGQSADIYYLKDTETLYYYHTSWHAEYVGELIGDVLSAIELKRIKKYVSSNTTQVKLC